MATREKTVIFAFPMTTALMADAVATNLTQITVYIPEASPVFKSVFLEVGFQDAITATGGTITEHRASLRLGAAGYTTVTELDDIANSGENMAGVIGPFDFTSHFTTNWTGTSMTCDVQTYFDQSTGTTQGMRNVTVMLYVTYSYDDTAATQIKTVRIPMDSLTGTLPTSIGSISGTQIPVLTGGGTPFLPEASPVIRDYFFVLEGNENNNNTSTDFTVSARIDTGTADTFQTQEAALGSDRFCRWIWKPSFDDTAAHSFGVASTVNNKCNHLTFTLYVTYEFTLSGTTRTLNSILIPIEIASPLGATTSAEASRFSRDFIISEPGTITLKHSAFRINYNVAATPTSHNWRAGTQSYRTYTPLASVCCGMFCMQQRIDAAAAAGTGGISLARGRNTFTIDGYATSTANQINNISGYAIINYESDVPVAGIGANAKTVMKVLLPWDAALTDRVRINNYAYDIPVADYWIVASGFSFIQWIQTAASAITFDVECLSGEGKGGGYYDVYADAYQSDSERSCTVVWMRGRDTFKRCPQDADPDRLDLETARDYRLFTAATCGNGITTVITYHCHTWTAAGTVSGNDAGLPTTVKLVDSATGEVMQVQELTAGTTAFSFTVYDNTEYYYIDAYQDATHVGRSALAQAA